MNIKMCRAGWSNVVCADGEAWTRGFAFYEGVLYKGAEFCSLVWSMMSGDMAGLARFCAKLNGCFAFACQRGGQLFLAVDNVRSMELLYMLQPAAMVFDDVNAIAPVQKRQLYEQGIQEYLSAGYVTGDRTLISDVYSLEAGMCGVITDGVISKRRYFRYELLNEHGDIPEGFDDKADQVFEEAFDRLIKSCEGKRIVVPLSGGYDSRLIVNYLHRKGFKDVLCYSYGITEDQDEARRSKQVATKLGYPWYFVRYERSVFDKKLIEGQMLPYFRYSRGCVNRPHVQEFVAVKRLSDDGVLDKDTDVIVPGFSFDMLAGSQVTQGVSNWNVVEKVVGREMYFWPIGGWPFCSAAVNALRTKNADLSASSFLEFATWQERIAKFIVNSVRVYEYFGFQWRLPLWDVDLIRVWLQLPQAYRLQRKYFRKWFESICEQELRAVSVADKGAKIGRLHAILSCFRSRLPYRAKMRWDCSLLRKCVMESRATGRTSFLGNVGFCISDLEAYGSVAARVGGRSFRKRLLNANGQGGNAWVSLVSLLDFFNIVEEC